MRASSTPSSPAGFTLIELLGVIAIIAILLGIVLSILSTAQRYSRKTIAATEVHAIADAWARYLDAYNRCPSNAEENVAYEIDASWAAALEGDRRYDALAAEINPDGIHFMEFSRFGEGRVPVNPWYQGRLNTNVVYYVKFDVDGDGYLLAPPDDTNIVRSVIVWTINPDEPLTNGLVRSWAR